MLTWFKDIPRSIWIFSGIWLVTGLLQSGLMELHPDEAYYWQMSRFMDWGYFHQPPMVAVFIKIGYALFQNELGVRLVTTLASTVGLLMLFKLSETTSVKTFLLIFLGLILTHAGVFMAVPDSPLIFFTLIFLALLKEYLKEDRLVLAICLGVVAAALMYSKYHAIILMGSVILAVPKLLLRRSFWLTAILATLLFLPHILWQFDHDLISFKFHWVVRDKQLWDIGILLNYVGSQLIMLGPVGLLLIWAIYTYRTDSTFDRVLKFIPVGFFGFFLILSFRSRIEANWTASAFLPLIILGTRAASQQAKTLKLLRPLSIGTMVILMAARLYLLTPWAGDGLKLNFPFKGWTEWAATVKDRANGLPVFFSNSYQFVSMYSFYAQEQGYHWSMINYNGNQFDLWDIDKKIEGKPIVVVFPYGYETDKSFSAPGFNTQYIYELEAYHSYRNLRFEFQEKELSVIAGQSMELTGSIVNHTDSPQNLDSLIAVKPTHLFFYLNGKSFPSTIIECQGCSGTLTIGSSKPVTFTIEMPDSAGTYFMRFGREFCFDMAEQNSDFIKLNVSAK